jgi:hypothetical protein
MMPSPALQVLLPVVGRGSRADEALEAAGDGLDGGERVVDLVESTRISRCQACSSSSRSARLRSVSTSSGAGAALPERGAAQLPAPGAAGEGGVHVRGASPSSSRRARAPPRAAQSSAPPAWPSSARRPGSPAAASVLGVEREDGDVDLLHHRAQQRRRLQRAEPLLAQRLASAFTSSSARPSASSLRRAAGADREVALEQRAEQVGQRLQRPHHALAQREREAEPEPRPPAAPSVH